jgi:hypothetical protein
MRFKDIKIVEYGMKPGQPTPVSAQQTGAQAKSQSVTAPSASPNTKSVSQSPTTTSAPSVAADNSEPETQPMGATAGELEVDTVIKDTNDNEMGVVVSKVGDDPNPDAVVVKDPRGKYQVMRPTDKVVVDVPVEESVFARFTKLTLSEQLTLLDQVDSNRLNEAWVRLSESDKIKGVDGKACWKGYRYAGKEKKPDGTYKDKCVPVKKSKNESAECKHGKYYCSTDKKWKCRQSPKKSRSVAESAVPDNSKVRIVSKLLAQPLLGNDVKSQMEAFFAIPSPQMIKDFRNAIASNQAETVDLRPILKNYIQQMHPSLQKKINVAESTIMEYGSLDAAKQEIIKGVQSIDTKPADEKIAVQNAQILDKLYSVLNRSQVLDRISAVLPDVLKNEYSEKTVREIADLMANAPVSFKEKNQFAENLANDKVIDAALLISPGIYTVDRLTYNDPVNRKMLEYMKNYGVGQKMKGPLEHALAIFSKEISIAGSTGDITVSGEPVELKAAVSPKRGAGGGRFGEAGQLPSRSRMIDVITSFDQLKPLVDQYLAKQKSMNISTFVEIVNQANLPPQTRAEVGKRVFGEIFGSEAKPVIDAFSKPNADPDNVRKAYIVSNFNWYKNSDQGGAWKYLVGISLVDNAVGVIESGADLLNISAYKKNPSVITTDKPQEMLFQFNPRTA